MAVNSVLLGREDNACATQVIYRSNVERKFHNMDYSQINAANEKFLFSTIAPKGLKHKSNCN